MIVTRLRWGRIILLVFCVGLSLLWAQGLRRAYQDQMVSDFSEIYLASRCALHHHDPYNSKAVLSEFEADKGEFSAQAVADSADLIGWIAIGVNLPTTLFLTTPLAIMSWNVALVLWLGLMAILLVIAGYLAWSLADDTAPNLAGCIIALMMLNCIQLLRFGNVAGVVVSLCVIATWCFVKDRYAAAGVLLLAIGLALKPHDSGFVWLYFLLAGGVMRKRALQTLGVVAVIGISAAIWIAPSSPHWLQGLNKNHEILTRAGATCDPALTGLSAGGTETIIDLQAAFSYFLPSPRSYTLAAALLAGGLIAAWAFVVLRKRATRESTMLALAVIAILTLLAVYHRPYDAKLLLLSIPACAMLWARGGANRWISFALMLIAVLSTSEIPLAILLISTKALGISAWLPPNHSVVLLLLPPLALLALASHFLWVLIRHVPGPPGVQQLAATESSAHALL